MHINQCSKCGQDFETKNPKRIVCPNCLYLDRAAAPSIAPMRRPDGGGPGGPRGGGHGHGGPHARPGGRPGFQPRGRGGPPPRGGRPGGPPRGRGGPGRPQQKPKKLLVSKEQLAEIEKRYKPMLPLPNPDAHVVIAEALSMEPHKVFFGINLIRQKLMLPKLEFPKRPLAVTPDQLMAVKALYEPFLPLPPIGVHKIIARQLKMDEWRVHVAIGLLRKQMALPRWNEDRDDLPEQMKEQLEAAKAAKAAEAAKADGDGDGAEGGEAKPPGKKKAAASSKKKEAAAEE